MNRQLLIMGKYRWLLYYKSWYPPINYADTKFNNLPDASKSVINILKQPGDYQNMWFDSNAYWQRKMTDKDWEDKRGPNRSPSWIPQRMEKQKEEMRKEIMNLFTVVYPGDSFFFKDPCLSCGLSYNNAKKAIQEYNELLAPVSKRLWARRKELNLEWNDYEGKAAFEEEYQQELRKIVQTLEPNYPPDIIKLLPTYHPLGTTSTGVRFNMGLCSNCYQRYEKVSRAFVDNVLENS